MHGILLSDLGRCYEALLRYLRKALRDVATLGLFYSLKGSSSCGQSQSLYWYYLGKCFTVLADLVAVPLTRS